MGRGRNARPVSFLEVEQHDDDDDQQSIAAIDCLRYHWILMTMCACGGRIRLVYAVWVPSMCVCVGVYRWDTVECQFIPLHSVLCILGVGVREKCEALSVICPQCDLSGGCHMLWCFFGAASRPSQTHLAAIGIAPIALWRHPAATTNCVDASTGSFFDRGASALVAETHPLTI